MQQHRLSSKEVREKMEHDPLFDSISWTKSFWDKHGNKITIGLLAIVVIYVGFQLRANSKATYLQQALDYYEMAQESYQASLDGTEKEAKAKKMQEAMDFLNKLETDYAGTPAALDGLILKANILKGQGDYVGARGAYESVAQTLRSGDLYVIARIGIAQCMATDENELGPAIQEYQSLREKFSDSPLITQIEFELAVLLDTANRENEALEIFKKFDDESPWYWEARDRIERLEAPVYLRKNSGA